MCYLYNIVSAEIYITFTFCCLVTFRSFMLYFILHVIIWTSCYPLPIILYFALHFKVCASCFTWPFMLYFVLHVILLSFMLYFCPSFYTLAFVLYFAFHVKLCPSCYKTHLSVSKSSLNLYHCDHAKSAKINLQVLVGMLVYHWSRTPSPALFVRPYPETTKRMAT